MIRYSFLTILFFTQLVIGDSLYDFENIEDEKRFYSLIKEIRCPKCTSGSLASSNAPVSVDIKEKIIELIKEGKTDKEIKQHIAARFGNSVLYNPGFDKNKYLLWISPFVILLISMILYFFRRRIR
jgi:cytochrome c-type biogenesis protein CcmH